jgi:sec-independent protein translocase protein TatA
MSLGFTEILLILGIALLFFGPSRLPGLGKSLGEAIRGFKKGISELEDEEKPGTREKLETGKSSTASTIKNTERVDN